MSQRRILCLASFLLLTLAVSMMFYFSAKAYYQRQPHRIVSIAPAAKDQPDLVNVTYIDSDQKTVTALYPAKLKLKDRQGHTVCLKAFVKGELPYGPLELAQAKAQNSTHICPFNPH